MLGCTPGHIPRYMGQTSNNNNNRSSYSYCYDPYFLYMIPVMIPAMIFIMIPVRMTVMTSFMYSGLVYSLFLFLDSCCSYYAFRFDYRMICNSDSIRLDIRWHEIKVYR